MMQIGIAMALAAVAGGCPGGREAQTPAALLQLEDRWIKLLETRDVAGLTCLLDESFTDSDAGGVVRTKADVLSRLPRRPDNSIEIQHPEVRVEGTMGYVRGLTITHDPQGELSSERAVLAHVRRANRLWRVEA